MQSNKLHFKTPALLMTNADVISVILADDHALARHGIRSFVEDDLKIKIIGEAENGKQAVDLCASLKPTLVLMDIEMPLMDGIEATRFIRENQPEVKIIMLSSHNSRKIILAALSAGANGYSSKDIDNSRLVSGIHTVAQGDFWLDAMIAESLLNLLPQTDTATNEHTAEAAQFGLSKREIEILHLIAEGKTNQNIASQLYLSVDTIKNHLKMIMQKLSVNDRTQAAVKAVREKLI